MKNADERRIIHSEDREREKRQKDPRTRMMRLMREYGMVNKLGLVLLALLLVGCGGTMQKHSEPFAVRMPADRPIIFGQVGIPGTTVEPGTDLIVALAKARGTRLTAAEARSYVVCPGEKPKRVDIEALKKGDWSQNITLRGGCVVVVPKSIPAWIRTLLPMSDVGTSAYILLND